MTADPSTESPGDAKPADTPPAAAREPPPLPPPPELEELEELEPSWWSTKRPRATRDSIGATAHVLRVRARLVPDEQRRFDELMSGDAAIDILTMLVNRSVEDAVDKLRQRLGDEPTGEHGKRTLASQIAAVSALLSAEERSTALARLASLWPEEQQALQARLLELSPAEAAGLIRTYLARR